MWHLDGREHLEFSVSPVIKAKTEGSSWMYIGRNMARSFSSAIAILTYVNPKKNKKK